MYHSEITHGFYEDSLLYDVSVKLRAHAAQVGFNGLRRGCVVEVFDNRNTVIKMMYNDL